MTIQSTIRLKPSQKLASKGKSVKYVLSLYNIGLIVFTSVGIRISLYQTEKLQLNSAMAQHQSTINELTGKLNDKENEIAKIKQETVSLKFDLANQTEDTESKTSSIQTLEEKLKKLQAEIDRYKKENAALKKQITTKNSEIEKLSNNVKLLKNQ